ncbi:2438_t:CDS:1, partial [Cetraspora pellucida]
WHSSSQLQGTAQCGSSLVQRVMLLVLAVVEVISTFLQVSVVGRGTATFALGSH